MLTFHRYAIPTKEVIDFFDKEIADALRDSSYVLSVPINMKIQILVINA